MNFDNIINKSFKPHFAPILIVGGGFGLGFGHQDKRFFNSFSHFLAAIGGLAYVLCFRFL